MSQKTRTLTKGAIGTKIIFTIFFTLSFFSFSFLLAAQEFTVIKNPKPTFTEKNFVTLEKVNEICDSNDEEEFIATPKAMTVDHLGNLYILDTAQVKILKYDRELNFVKAYGRLGVGPGDFMIPTRFVKVGLYCNDKNIFILIGRGSQLVILDLNLNYIDEFRLNLEEKKISPYFSVNRAGDFAFYSMEGKGSVLVLNREMKRKAKFSIDLKLFDFLYFTPPRCLIENMSNCFFVNIKHDFLKDSRLVVYSLDTSTLFVFKNNRLENKFNLYSKKILDRYKPLLVQSLKELSDALKRGKRVVCGYRSIFSNFFNDTDTGKSFYLEYRDVKKKQIYLYNFDYKGKLLKIFQISGNDAYSNRTAFKLKRNRLFYAIANDNEIVTYKEKSNAK